MQFPPTTAPGAIAAPFVRVFRLDMEAKVVSAAAGLFGFLGDPVFWFGWCLLALFSGWDWVLGTRVAITSDTYDRDRAYNGILSKITGLVLVFGLRALAAWAGLAGILPAEMAVSVVGSAATAALILAEIKSIGHKQVALGGGSLTPVIGLLDRVFGARGATPTARADADTTTGDPS